MTLIFTHDACARHAPGSGHPERPERLRTVMQALQDASVPGPPWRQAPHARREQLARVHHADHIERVFRSEPARGTHQFDADTRMSPGSLEAALRAAGAGCAAVDALLAGESKRAFCAVRPPGHHATADTAMGFCLFNNIAVATAHALHQHGLARVAIADFDVHHGNGTQAIFANEPRVLYLSSQQMPLYPGSGDPAGNNAHIHNVALAPGSGSAAFRNAWQDQLLPALDDYAPELLLISAGFDADARDPLAQLEIGPDDYIWITRELCALADRHGDGRVLSMLEGGYDLEALAEGVTAHLRALG